MPSSASRMRSSRRRRRREARRGEGREKERGGGGETKEKKNKKGWHALPRAMQANAVDAPVHVPACMHARTHSPTRATRPYTHTNNTHIYTHTHMRVRAGRVVSVSPRLKTRAHAAWEKKKDAVLAFLPPALSVPLSLSLSLIYIRSYRCAEDAPGGRRAVLHPIMKWWRGGGARSFRCGRGNERR